jgi:hypothetical protein
MLLLAAWSNRDRVRGNLETRRAGIAARMAVAVLAWSAAMALPGAPAQADCRELLGNRSYQCRVKEDTPDSFDDCFSFTTPGEQSEDFDLFSDLLGDVLSCDCKVVGTFRAPEFSEANSFHCVSRSDAELGLAFDSEVKRRGRRLVGEGINEFGDSFFFRCDRVRSCELPPSSQGDGARSW